MAYNSVFGHPGTPAQIQHFVDQVNFFDTLYTAAGLSNPNLHGTDYPDLVARAAIYGQMFGIEAEITQTQIVGTSAQHV